MIGTAMDDCGAQTNDLSGPIPNSPPPPHLVHVELSGDVLVEALAKFGAVSFLGNAALCGLSPLPNCRSDIANPRKRPGCTDITVSSNPRSPRDGHTDITRKKNGLGPGPIVAIVLANAMVLVAVTFMVAYCCSRDKGLPDGEETGKRNSYGSERKVYANGSDDSDETSSTDKGRLVFFEWKKGFELEDLRGREGEMALIFFLPRRINSCHVGRPLSHVGFGVTASDGTLTDGHN